MAAMSSFSLPAPLMAAVPLTIPAAAAPAAVAAGLRANLERVARERVCFGHQSVGANIIQGLQELAAEAGVPLRVIRADRASEVPEAAFGHTFVAQNGEPLRKLESFWAALGSAQVQTGWKALVKRLLGRAPYGTVENVRREEYSRLLRQAYAGREPVFDLARVESTAPDGRAVRVLAAVHAAQP